MEGSHFSSHRAPASVGEDIHKGAHLKRVVLTVEKRWLPASSGTIESFDDSRNLNVVDLVLCVQDSHEVWHDLQDDAERLCTCETVGDEIPCLIAALSKRLCDEVVELDMLHLIFLRLEVPKDYS